MTPEERASRIIKSSLWEYIDPCLSPERIGEICDETESIIADEIHAAIAEATRWIPVAERLPEPGDEVLIYAADEGFAYLGCYSPHNKSWCADGVIDDVLHGATHWQPLPPPPEVA